jgi:hypothetical protein
MENPMHEINELFKLLNLHVTQDSDYPESYDVTTPYEKCSLVTDVPTTISNLTIIAHNTGV